MVEEQLTYITGVHGHCHDSRHALEVYEKRCLVLENELVLLTGRLEQATLQSNTTDSTQNVNEQTLQVTPVNNFVQSITCFNLSCCPTSSDSLLQEENIKSLLQENERLKGIIKELEEKINPIQLYNPGMIRHHPDYTLDLESGAIMDDALKLAKTLSAKEFESLCMNFNELVFKHRVGIDNAVSDIGEEIDRLIPFSTNDDKEAIARAIITCAARMIVWKPNAKEECQKQECKSFCLRRNAYFNIIL